MSDLSEKLDAINAGRVNLHNAGVIYPLGKIEDKRTGGHQVIPDEAVEAAAKAIYEAEPYGHKWDWEVSEVTRKEYRMQARAALEAAAPHMLIELRE